MEGEGAVIQDAREIHMDSCLRYWTGGQVGVQVEDRMAARLAILEVNKVDLVGYLCQLHSAWWRVTNVVDPQKNSILKLLLSKIRLRPQLQ